MDISEQVCTKEQAEKLKSLNVVQKSYFIYSEAHGFNIRLSGDVNFCSAYTCAELGKMLPYAIYFKKDWYFLDGGHNYICYRNNERYTAANVGWENGWISRTEAQARADLLITLLTKFNGPKFGVNINNINDGYLRPTPPRITKALILR